MRNPAEAAARQRISILEYLEQRGWKKVGDRGNEEVRGLCPLHRETRASFYVNQRKQVFYCHGCGHGGDVIRLVQLCEGIGYAQARRKVEQTQDGGPVMEAAIRFHEQELGDHRPAMHYLLHRGIKNAAAIGQMRIGYAPGGCLRAHLSVLGYDWTAMRASGLIDEYGRDYFYGCVVFPLEGSGSMYGRSVTDHGVRHRFLPRPKGGLYGWSRSSDCEELIVVEGLFDVAVLWQGRFPQHRGRDGEFSEPGTERAAAKRAPTQGVRLFGLRSAWSRTAGRRTDVCAVACPRGEELSSGTAGRA